MSQTCAPSTQRRYGPAPVWRVWELARSAVYLPQARQRRPAPSRRSAGRRGRGVMRSSWRRSAVLAAAPFLGEGHRKVWARLRWHAVRTSKARVLRLMRAPSAGPYPRGPRARAEGARRDDHHGRAGPDVGDGRHQLSGAARGTATVFVVADHCASECIGVHAAKPGTRFEAVEPLRQGVRALFGRYEAGIAVGLQARHDHGRQYVSDYFQGELKFLGIASSPAFVRKPEGNGAAERFIRTLKEDLLWARTFDTLVELRQALLAFKERYNREWLCERHGHQMPLITVDRALRAATDTLMR